MKSASQLKLSFIFILFIMCTGCFAQRGGRGHGGGYHEHRGGYGGNKIIVKRSIYRPVNVYVYHPFWRPKYSYYRRWIFFPKYNLYWDNWRNNYVFWNGTIWLSQPTPPPVIVNVNLQNEKHQELKEDEDDVDDVYKDNAQHKAQIKP